MAVAADRYSKLVAWLKIILPLIALAMLSTLFLVSRTIDPSQSIPYADVDVEDLARNQRIGSPTYTGKTLDGSAVLFRAEVVRPEAASSTRVLAEKPSARIDLPTGKSVELAAKAGYFDRAQQVASLDGEVLVETSDGYRLATDHAETRLDLTLMRTAGSVTGEGPLGDLKAGQVTLEQVDDGSYVLRFENGVNLVYRPGQ